MNQPLVHVALIALGGAAIAVQAPINSALGRTLASPLAAATLSFGVGFVALLLLSLLTGDGALARAMGAPAWQLAGGLLGAFYIWVMVSGVSSLGALTAFATLIFGQLAAALLVDHLGAFGLATQPVSFQRLLAVALVGAGLILSRN
jgi:transporter family-2 protein